VRLNTAGLEPGRYELVVQDVRTTSEWGEATGSGATVTRCAEPRAVEEGLAFMACDR
jgi:hypothetical protein